MNDFFYIYLYKSKTQQKIKKNKNHRSIFQYFNIFFWFFFWAQLYLSPNNTTVFKASISFIFPILSVFLFSIILIISFLCSYDAADILLVFGLKNLMTILLDLLNLLELLFRFIKVFSAICFMVGLKKLFFDAEFESFIKFFII